MAVMAGVIAWILLIIVAYIFIMFILAPLIIPNLGWKRPLKETLPADVKKKLVLLGKKHKNKEDVLKFVLALFLNRFHSEFGQSFTRFYTLCDSSFAKLWKKGGFLHCHQLNLVLRHLLMEID